MPTLTKLTVKTRYDDYFAGLETEKAISAITTKHERGKEIIALIQETNIDLSTKLSAGFANNNPEHKMSQDDQRLAERVIAKTMYSNYRDLTTVFQSEEHAFEFPLRIIFFIKKILSKIPVISWFFKD